MTSKTAVSSLQRRGPAPLHRTFPMWAREPKGEGVIEWRMYRGHASGSALVIASHSSPGMSRTEVARGLRTFRNVLFGRDKIQATENAQEPAPPTPPTEPAGDHSSLPATVRLSAESQGSLF